jgi:hypothetical protein
VWPEIMEAGMLVAFGSAWPASILKSWQSRTSKGKSLSFLLIIQLGYLLGIGAKLMAPALSYVTLFYLLNMLAVSIDIVLYFRNRRLDETGKAR